jgi:hypothetical protein
MDVRYIVWSVAGTAICAASVLPIWLQHRRRRSFLAARGNMGLDDIFREFYADAGIAEHAVVQAWREVAECLGVNAGQLRPADRLSDLRGVSTLFESDVDDLGLILWRHSITTKTIQRMPETIDGVVRLLALAHQQEMESR